MADPSPGQIITPGGDSSEPSKQSVQEVSVDLPQAPQAGPSPTAPVQPPPQNIPSPQAVAQPASSQPAPAAAPPSEPQPQQPSEGGFAPQFDIGSPATSVHQTDNPETNSSNAISWTASEYIAHQKSFGWYGALAAATVLFAGLVYWLTGGDFVSIGVVIFAALVFGIYAGKQPKEQAYSISPAGVGIGGKVYDFSQLKTFSITNEGAFSSITFLPMKRFMPAISIYYDPTDEDAIVEALTAYLPMDVEKRDVVDNFMRKIRF